jgi:hypothetical protein
MADGGRKVVYEIDESGCACVFKNRSKGSEYDCGICPDGSPGRGSGSIPENLDYIKCKIE